MLKTTLWHEACQFSKPAKVTVMFVWQSLEFFVGGMKPGARSIDFSSGLIKQVKVRQTSKITLSTLINDRIDVRISREQKELFKFACDLRGFKSLTEFIVFCTSKEANQIIIENNQVLKSIEDKKVFLNAILNPPSPNSKLKSTFRSQKILKQL